MGLEGRKQENIRLGAMLTQCYLPYRQLKDGTTNYYYCIDMNHKRELNFCDSCLFSFSSDSYTGEIS